MRETLQVVSALLGIVPVGVVPLLRWVLVAPSVPDARLERARKFRDEREEIATYLDGIGEDVEATRQRERGDMTLARALEQNDAARTLTLTGRLLVALVTYAVFSGAISLIIVGLFAQGQVLIVTGAGLLIISGVCLMVWVVLSLRAERQREHLAQARAAGFRASPHATFREHQQKAPARTGVQNEAASAEGKLPDA